MFVIHRQPLPPTNAVVISFADVNNKFRMLPFHKAVSSDFESLNQLILKQLHSDVGLVENIGHYLIEAGGKRLASGSADDTLIIWDSATGEQLIKRQEIWCRNWKITKTVFPASRLAQGENSSPLEARKRSRFGSSTAEADRTDGVFQPAAAPARAIR